MTVKFENQQVMSSTAVSVVLAECKGFEHWPQGNLPAPVLSGEEELAELKLFNIKEGGTTQAIKKAEQALAKVYGPHPIIRTPWGMLLGRTAKCPSGSQMYHAIEVFTSACWDLATPEIWKQFGTGNDFSPYGDLAYEMINSEVRKFNTEVEDYPVQVAVGDNYTLLEISCKFKKTSDQSGDKAAFSALMRFTESLFESGRMDVIVAQSCDPSVLKRAMISSLWSMDADTEIGKLAKVSGTKAKLCKYDNLPALSSIALAAGLTAIGVEAGNWPTACMPDEPVAIYKSRLAKKISTEFPAIGARERAKFVKDGVESLLEPRPTLRTQWGMIRLTQYIVEGFGGDRGMYSARIYLQKGWETGRCAEWSERAALLLEDRTRRLLTKSKDHPIEISDCDEYGIVDISCDFSLADGPEEAGEREVKCAQALADYLFYIFATGLLDTTLTDACSEKPIVFVDEPVEA